MSNLEERVKALEDQMQRLAQTFIQAPAPKQVNPLQAQPANVDNVLSKFTPEHQKHIKLVDGKIYMAEFVSNERWKELNEVAKANGYHWKKDASNSKNSSWSR